MRRAIVTGRSEFTECRETLDNRYVQAGLSSPFGSAAGLVAIGDSYVTIRGGFHLLPLPKSPMPTLFEAINKLSVDQIKALIALLPAGRLTGKKPELVDTLYRAYEGDGARVLWERLDELEQAALADAIYYSRGRIDLRRVKAKFGRTPPFSSGREHYTDKPTRIRLFFYYDQDGAYALPLDLVERLKTFVPQPERDQVRVLETIPESIGEEPVSVRATESEALADLPFILRLTEQGKLRVSDKTRLPGAATLKLLAAQCVNGDYYPEAPKVEKGELELGPIKAFGWPLLLQAGGLAQESGGKLVLSKSGVKALRGAPADVLRELWAQWLKSTRFDEFSRVDAIKGQRSKGRVMTAVPPRRAAIAEALRCCPVGEWIETAELGRFMRAEGIDFEVTHDPWKLYIFDPNYGSLGYQGFHDWNILQFSYLLALLFEYAAPLGLIDIAYIMPEDARGDYCELWGSEDLRFLTRYDGLMYFRLTELGAYCLGLRPDYTPSRPKSSLRLAVLPSLQVNVVAGKVAADEVLLLDTWATRVAETGWVLDRTKSVAAIEKGHDIATLLDLLCAGDDQPLPETVEAFAKLVREQGAALKTVATALLIKCANAEIARQISEHPETKQLCLLAGDCHLTVRIEHEAKFRAVVHVLGFGWLV